jgi:hypothetical protein
MAGDWDAKGCFIYAASYYDNYYGGMAFFGTGGSQSEMTSALSDPYIRLEGECLEECSPETRDLTTEEGCKAEADERGLTTEASDMTFAGAWEADGCYMYASSYENGYYDGRVYFGTGGNKEDKSANFCDDQIHLRVGVCGEEIPQKDCSIACSAETRDLTTEEGCRAEAEERGLATDANFAGDWEVNGCYMYDSSYENGYYNGLVYFGTGGSDEDKTSAFCDDSIHIRVGVCGEEIPQVDCSVPCSAETRDLTTEEGCKAEADERGLTTEASDMTFAGAWEADGCFMYVSSYYDGYYDGRVYFGTGGSKEKKSADFCDD